jgi:hypothetical protein
MAYDTPTDVILTEDGHDVRVGDRVFCYYDRYWGVIQSIEDTHQGAVDGVDPRNQVLWAEVFCDDGRVRSYNGQRLATKEE